MRRVLIVFLALSLFGATAWAQMHEGMMEEQAPQPPQSEQWQCPHGMGPGMGYGGWGMGPGMMGYGGCGMMGPGWGMGPGMMGYGGCGMMPGWGMGPGMMGYGGYGMMGHGGWGMRWQEQGGKYQKFLDDTRDLRKELHMKQFDYFEAMRNPETTGETIAKLGREIRDLIKKIYEKAPWGKKE
jgi:hypothetical protein